MFVKLAVFACSLALAAAAYNGPLAGGQPAALYPAGVDPKACPNFPDCTNPSVAVNQIPQDQFQPQYRAPQQYNAPQQYPQQYNAPINQYNPVQPQQYAQQRAAQYPPQVQNALDRGEYIGDGDYHGEGLAEALAPGYQAPQQQAQYNAAPAQYNAQPAQYNAQPAQYNAQPAQYNPQPAQIPAGLNAQACPNYPFCH